MDITSKDTRIVTDEGSGILYVPWTDGHAVGFKVVHPDSTVGYVYLNPSQTGPAPGHESDDSPCVFVYSGIEGDPTSDDAIIYVSTVKEEMGL